jgi:hypothetical protein
MAARNRNLKPNMKITPLLAGFILIGLASPASARNYYVVQNTKTLKCSVLPKKPKGKTVVIVSGTTAYKRKRTRLCTLRRPATCDPHFDSGEADQWARWPD